MYLVGIMQSISIVILSSIFNIYIMFCNQNFDIHPIIFTMFCVLAASWSLLLFSGPGKLGAKTVFNFKTWVQGLSLLMNMILAIHLIKYVSGAEVAILRRMSVPISIILALLVLKRIPKKVDFISFSILLLSCLIIIFMQNETSMEVLQLTIIAAFMQCSSFMLAETHQQSVIAQQGIDLKDKARVVSFANFISTVLFLLFLVICSICLKYFPNLHLNYLSFIPNLSDYYHLPSIACGLAFGFIFSPFLRYFIWSASYKIKSENVLTILALIPITTYIFQIIFGYIGLIDVEYNVFHDSYSILVFIITLFMTLAACISSYLKSYKKMLNIDGKNIFEKIKNSMKAENYSISIGVDANSNIDYEVIKNTIDFYEGDMNKAAKILEIPIDTVKTFALNKYTYSLRDDVSKKVHEIFRNKIFYLDQLTGIENKKGLIRKFMEYQNKMIPFNLYYMDINKFKNINDTLGHNIGDIVIIESINRICKYAIANHGSAYRLGGDEFAMITTSEKSEQQIISEIKDIINLPISYDIDGISGTSNPSISIGRANIIKDENVKIKDIIQSADKNMYEDKES